MFHQLKVLFLFLKKIQMAEHLLTHLSQSCSLLNSGDDELWVRDFPPFFEDLSLRAINLHTSRHGTFYATSWVLGSASWVLGART